MEVKEFLNILCCVKGGKSVTFTKNVEFVGSEIILHNTTRMFKFTEL